jgi:minor capsid protein
MDFLPRIMDALESNIDLNAPLKVGLLEPASSAAAIRTVSSGIVTRYLNGDTIYHIAFQLLIQDADQQKAVNILDDITDYLDGLTKDSIISGDNSFTFITSNVSVLPNLVQKTENDEYVYTAIFAAQIERKGV